MADNNVAIYGRLNTAIEYVTVTTATDGTRLGNTARLTNNRSVFGLRGEEQLANGIKAIWQIESALSIDNGTGQIAARDTRLGLQSPYGTLFMGNWDTPYTSATKSYDPLPHHCGLHGADRQWRCLYQRQCPEHQLI